MNILREFIKMSKYAGQREDLVQAGGGNSSVKLDENNMLIKTSGFQLADITAESGYSTIDHTIIVDFFNNTPIDKITDKYEKQLLNESLISGSRPSIETFLHAITDVFTLHTHPMLVNVLTAREDGVDILKKLFPEALIVDYVTPGIKLAKEYFKTYKEYSTESQNIFDIIFLKNHGLIVSAKSAEDVIRKTEKVLLKIEKYLSVDMSKYRNSTLIYNKLKEISKNQDGDIVYLSNDLNIKNSLNIFKDSMWKFWFCPDCLVYCGKRPLVLKEDFDIEDIKNHIYNYGKPIVIYYESNIYIYSTSVKKAKEIESVLSFSAQVACLNKDLNMDLLCEEEQNFLLNWESEKYRQNLK
ncbi:class II aldolase [Clostridium botulinum]|uniref:class II aldolase/adducin family protein n=1 Tax=Clostridium botulinum TaxID=1491 RepID=UPI0019686229|nr:class II aldolase/adducin family protein [Clostridium botulinum]MBN1075617.1 class II aldolase [Clostridium botulinum]